MYMTLQAGDAGGEIREDDLRHVDREASVLEASRLMRNTGATELLVVDRCNGMRFAFGVLTASDIVTRVVAAGLDPAVLTTGDIAWSGMTAPN